LEIRRLFISGVNITPYDNAHYDQFFIHGALGEMVENFRSKDNWFKCTNHLEGESISKMFLNLWHSDNWSDLCVCNWVPCTAEYISAIIPYENQLYLCCCSSKTLKDVHYESIDMSVITNDVSMAREYIVSQSNNPNLQLDIN